MPSRLPPRLPTLLLAVFIITLAGCVTPSTKGGRTDAVVADKSATLDRAYEQFWDESLKLNPLQATFQGDPRYNDALPNFLGADYRKRSHEFNTRWLKKIQAIGSTGLTGQDLISYEIFVHDAKSAIDAEQFANWQLPINQFYSVANLAMSLGSGNGSQPFKTVADYDNWRKRAERFPALFDQAIVNMRAGVAKGVVQPRALMEGVVPQLDAVIKDKPEDTPFWMPVKTMPPSFPDEERIRITNDYRELIAQRLVPAYQRLHDYIANDYMGHTGAGVGIGALPGGDAWYAYDVRQNTSTDLTPAQVRKLGLDEVARLQGEIRKLMKGVGFKGSLHAFFESMRSDKRFDFKDTDAMLARYREIQRQVDDRVSQLFLKLPTAKLEVRAVEPYREATTPAGEYQGGSVDGKRPATFYVNTSDPGNRHTWEAEDLYLHEAIPGHHVQIALQQELHGLPKFRSFGGETAFTEGWGVYAETLGDALGMYKDPYDRFGYLHNQLWRALRLVAGTGLNSRGWNRERTIKYLLDNSAATPAQAAAEVERYMAVPGQALAYKIGELKIVELRDKAKTALGPKFDIRQFHTEVLRDGSVPLDVLEAKIDRWIAAQQKQ